MEDAAVKPEPTAVSSEVFRDGMAHLPGAVNIVTTDGAGGRAGLTASAVCSVTADPPTLLVCVNRGSSAAPAFLQNDAVCVNTTTPAHRDLAMLFGGKTPMDDRFEQAEWTIGPSGAPMLTGAVVSFDCTVSSRSTVGSHEVLFCRIIDIQRTGNSDALVYYSRKFHELEA